MDDVRGSWWELQIQVKRFTGQHDACEWESDQHQSQRDKQYQKSHSELVFVNGGMLSATSPCKKTASLPARLSFAIDNPNGIKEPKYYHIPNLAINRWA